MPTEAELKALIERHRGMISSCTVAPCKACNAAGKVLSDLESLLRPQEPERPKVCGGRVEFPDPLTGEPRWRLATAEEIAAAKAEPEQAARERSTAPGYERGERKFPGDEAFQFVRWVERELRIPGGFSAAVFRVRSWLEAIDAAERSRT